MRVFRYFLLAIGIFFVVGGIAAGSFFRDGLGPDAVTSHGQEALLRTLELSWPFVILGLILIGVEVFTWKPGTDDSKDAGT